jgi:serine/threonine protein kinase
MSDDRWRRVEDLFHQAADLPGAERSAFLNHESAGDDDLLRDVESLLAHGAANERILSAAVGRALDKLPEPSGSADEFIGKQIGTYVITELIGKGGMGIVFKAHDNRLNRPVAIKALVRDCFADAERKRRFLHEAKAASALNHPNIVTIHAVAEEDGTDLLIMEYVSGKTLDRLIPRHGLPLKQALKYALEIGDALAAAHAAGIVHRDIKPSNVMLTDQGRVKILDFGLAKHAKPIHEQKASGLSSTLSMSPGTEPGLVVGTADYMSPEQAEGKPVDSRSDIFSFGALLWPLRDPGAGLVRKPHVCERLVRRALRPGGPAGERVPAAGTVADVRHPLPRAPLRGWAG